MLCTPLRVSILALPVTLGEQRRIIPHSLDNTKTLGSPLTEQQSVARSQIFWPLHKPESHRSAIARADERSVDVNDGACLRNGPYVEHGLVFLFDSGDVVQDQDIGDEFVVHFG